MKIKAVGANNILRYRKQDIEGLRKIGMVLFINVFNMPEHICSIALIESTNHPEFKKGDEAIVSYRIGYDTDVNERESRQPNKYFLERQKNGDEIRWCSDYDIFGVIRGGEMIPKKEYVFAELPPPAEEKTKGGIIIPEAFREQKTDKKGYWTKVKHIHPEHKEKYNLQPGQEIYCEKNSDIQKEIFGEKLLFIPIQKVLGWKENGALNPIAT